ncbi:hypothetical protein EW026_g8404 [Hermanssonia centrifuga]|uniref:Transposase n=1 Tax=Hermanssonia centrifuga TaxID=98765 RepID=A0A4S4K5X7_9APHY|nr:hypothetical protein EW026_g8404 [Hermanssonia centrifuga]
MDARSILRRAHFPPSAAVSQDINIKTAKQLLLDGLTVGIHMGTSHQPSRPYDANKVHNNIKYSAEDDKVVDDWVADHVEATRHSVAKLDDATLINALQKYHRQKLTDNKRIAQLLHTEHGLQMSDTTVKRRRRELGLVGSKVNAREIPLQQAEQLVLQQLDQDPAKHHGVCTIQAKVAFNSGVHIARQTVSDIMHIHAPGGFDKREPTSDFRSIH